MISYTSDYMILQGVSHYPCVNHGSSPRIPANEEHRLLFGMLPGVTPAGHSKFLRPGNRMSFYVNYFQIPKKVI
jgi:hypothetical protein